MPRPINKETLDEKKQITFIKYLFSGDGRYNCNLVKQMDTISYTSKLVEGIKRVLKL